MTSPLMVAVPASAIERTIFDDHVSSPACHVREDRAANAISFACSGADGAVQVRAYQDGAELVVDVYGEGDVSPSMKSGRLRLPPGARARFVAKLPTKLAPGASGP